MGRPIGTTEHLRGTLRVQKLVCGVGLTGLVEELTGLDAGLLPDGWPVVEMIHRRAAPSPVAISMSTPDAAAWSVSPSVQLLIDRASQQAVVVAETPPSPDDLLDPLVSFVGAVFAHWAGGDALHAGAAVFRRHAWGVLGGSKRGKSTLLACLAQRHVSVLADDVLVIRSGAAFAGPRTLYLRPDAAHRMRVARQDAVAASSEKVRLPLGRAPLKAPLAGWVVLRPGPEVCARSLSTAERLDVLVRFRTLWSLAPPGPAVLELVELPAFELRHPLQWQRLDDVCDRLEELAQRYG